MRIALVLALTACGWISAAAWAQPAAAIAPTDRSFLERLAFARARADLYDQVEKLVLAPELTVGGWAVRDTTRHRELRRWIRTRPRYGGPRVYSDGTCDVDVRLAPDELGAKLIALLERHPPEQEPKLAAADIMKAAGRWPVLWGGGRASLTERTRSRKPVGWENIGFDGIELARRAAVADAVDALLEKAGRMKVTAARWLREFLESDDDVFEAGYEAISNAATITVDHAPDQVAVAEARIGMADLIRILTEVHQQHYHGDVFHAADFREMALSARQSDLRAEGLAAPPERYRQREPYELIELDTPRWVEQTLSVTGRYDPLDTESFARDVQIELARFDGMDELRKKVEALVVKDGVTVEQLLGYRRELKDDVVIFLSGTRVVGNPYTEPDGTLKVPVELPLERLWLIVRRGMERGEVDPPEQAAPTTQPAPTTHPSQEDSP